MALPILPRQDREEMSSAIDLSLVRVPAGPVLFSGSGASYQQALSYLSSCEEKTLIRLTGGCLNMTAKEGMQLENVLRVGLRVPHHAFRGIFLNGGTVSESKLDNEATRLSVPEIGARISALCEGARCMGVIPGAEFNEASNRVKDDGAFDVRIHQAQSRVLVSEKRTPYIWDAEWQKVLEVRDALMSHGAVERSVLISYDGGEATNNEIQEWARSAHSHSNTHIVLLRGGDTQRATDTLARRVSWLQTHPNVHSCEFSGMALQSLLSRLGCFEAAAAPRFKSRVA